jgi:EAL domain-containing protein (putative c-di-GMP-specific phosphodiesterase class I)
MSSTNPLSPSFHVASLLSRLGVGSSADSGNPAATCIVASITNLRQIEQAHGVALALTVRHIVYERARRVCEAVAGVATMSGDHILFVFDVVPQGRPWHRPDATHVTLLLEQVLSALGDRSIDSEGTVVFPVIAARAAPFIDGPFDITAVAATVVPHGHDGCESRARFVSDMNVAESLFNALDEYRLSFQWEPICVAQGANQIEYYEALLCEMRDGVLKRVENEIPALERLGLVRMLNQRVVESVIDELRLNPSICLGCNVSAQSATLDAWWAFILMTLGKEPGIASRLIIEITENGQLIEPETAREFVRALQSLGCRVALADVGGGCSSFKGLMELGVDVAKIHVDYLRRARTDAKAAERLRQLVGLAKTCASSIVVEGVESDADVQISRSSGATHFQGSLYSRPGPRVNESVQNLGSLPWRPTRSFRRGAGLTG